MNNPLKDYNKFIFENELYSLLEKNSNILEYYTVDELLEGIDEGLFSGIKDKLAALSKTVSDPAKRAAQKEKLKKAMGDIKDKVSKKKENLSNQIDRLKDRFSKFKKQQLG